ncbi:MAG: hypothetical protein WAW85_14420 [Gordonia sp. (in: high G+C Gram-positive bacteria)]|uniref:hypothetical protein n=1 Tax=Gordonia sp. (in: high G+C Gram-positive bacteria) TaxID=84139 RepID=UPI003BB71E1A
MTDDVETIDTPRRSPALVIAGVIAIMVAAWGLTGGVSVPALSLLPWILIVAGTLAGIVLIASGFRRSR